MEAQKSYSSSSEYRPMWIVWSVCAFVNLISLSAESFCTPEEKKNYDKNYLNTNKLLNLKKLDEPQKSVELWKMQLERENDKKETLVYLIW